MNSESAWPMFVMQFLLAVCGLAGLAIAPPAHGRILLLPVTTRGAELLAANALDRGAAIVARGPFDRSIVVQGDRTRLLDLLGSGVVLMRARAAECGSLVENDR